MQPATPPTDDITREFGATIYDLRHQHRWTQAELSAHLRAIGTSMTQSTIAKLESGDRPTNLAELAGLARVFNTHAPALLTATDSSGRIVDAARAGQLAELGTLRGYLDRREHLLTTDQRDTEPDPAEAIP